MTNSIPLTHEQIRNYHPQENCLEGKVILVTGAGDGIGRVASLNYARYGATVLLLGKTLSKLEYVYDEIESFGGKQPLMLPMNLESASHEAMREMARKIQQEFGKIDGILHNAGILGELEILENYDVDTFQEVMHVNFTATFMLTQALFNLLKSAETASVVFTSSGAGREPRGHWGAYALSKHAIEGMCTMLTAENSDSNLRFNCINPGATRTAMRAKARPKEDPMSLLPPEDIMQAYIGLMTDDCSAVKGQSIDLQPNR